MQQRPGAAGPDPQAVRLDVVEAREVIIDANIRTNTKIFVASIRQHGGIVPFLACPGSDGRIRVEDGQRRVL